jgi:hypothetical protein
MIPLWFDIFFFVVLPFIILWLIYGGVYIYWKESNNSGPYSHRMIYGPLNHLIGKKSKDYSRCSICNTKLTKTNYCKECSMIIEK